LHQNGHVRGTPTFTVYELGDKYIFARDRSSNALARFDRERQVITAARQFAAALGCDTVRVVFVVPVEGPNHPPTPGVKKT